MSNNRIKRYSLQIFLISSLVILVSSNNKIFASPISNENEASKIEQRIEEKIKEIEKESDYVVNLSKESMSTINSTASSILGMVSLVTLGGFVFSLMKQSDNKEEKAKFEAQIKKYKEDIKETKSDLTGYKEDIKETKSALTGYEKDMNVSLAFMYEKLGDMDIEREEYNSALSNYKKSFEYNNDNNDVCYKIGREIERSSHNIVLLSNNGVNEEWLENRKKALVYYEKLINKKNIKGYIGKINILSCAYHKWCDEIDNAIDCCEEAIKICDDDNTRAKIYSHLGFLYTRNEDKQLAIKMYNTALIYDNYNIDANIALIRNSIEENIENKYDYVFDKLENILKSKDGIYSGYLKNISINLTNLYYNENDKFTPKDRLRLNKLIERLINEEQVKPNHSIHTNIENMNRYGKDSINYIHEHNTLYKLRGDIFHHNEEYNNAIKYYKKILNSIQNNNLQTSTVGMSLADNKKYVHNWYDVYNDIGYILTIHMKEYDEAIMHYNSAISYINAEIEDVKSTEDTISILNELIKQKLHIYTNKGYAYQCKAKDKKTTYKYDTSIAYDLFKAIKNYKKAIEDYKEYISENYENEEERNYIKAYYRQGEAYKFLGDFCYESPINILKHTENNDLSKECYKHAKKYFEKIKETNNIEKEYLESVEEYNIHLYIISDKDMDELNSLLIEIDKRL